MTTIVKLINFRRPPVGLYLEQRQINEWLASASTKIYGADAHHAASLYRKLANTDSIEGRQTVVADFSESSPAAWSFFREGRGFPWYAPPLDKRMDLYQKVSEQTIAATFEDETSIPDALIHVTCTGYTAPSAPQRLISKKGWPTRLYSMGHMGCFAAVPALEVGQGLLSSGTRRIGIHLFELCTLHSAPFKTSSEQVVIQHLFGDGAITFDLIDEIDNPEAPGFTVEDTFSFIVPDSEKLMTWIPTDTHFAMTLARRVPDSIGHVLPGLIHGFLAKHGLERQDVHQWAIHPGGSKIIEKVAATLELEARTIVHSQAIFKRFGNMSSVTLPYIWAAIADDNRIPSGSLVLSLAFGPGLTITGNLLRRCGLSCMSK